LPRPDNNVIWHLSSTSSPTTRRALREHVLPNPLLHSRIEARTVARCLVLCGDVTRKRYVSSDSHAMNSTCFECTQTRLSEMMRIADEFCAAFEQDSSFFQLFRFYEPFERRTCLRYVGPIRCLENYFCQCRRRHPFVFSCP